MGSLVDILKFSGEISLKDLFRRASDSPHDLVLELKNLRDKGMVEINGPLQDALLEALEPHRSSEAAKTTVELSRRGLRAIMPG